MTIQIGIEIYGNRTLCIDGFDSIPHLHRTRNITRSYVEAGGGETGDGRRGCVLNILLADRGVVDGSKKDRFT